jgi:hypothetical protein
VVAFFDAEKEKSRVAARDARAAKRAGPKLNVLA